MAVHHRVLKTELAIFDLPEDLPAEDRALLEVARQATANSYSPYSNFKVGAAVRLTNGQIISGSNQENIAYPSGLCAESICMFAAGAQFPAEAVVALAVTTVSGSTESEDLVTPCEIGRA